MGKYVTEQVRTSGLKASYTANNKKTPSVYYFTHFKIGVIGFEILVKKHLLSTLEFIKFT